VFANGIGAGFHAQVALEAKTLGWLRGTHVGRPGVTMVRSRRIVAEFDAPLAVHADGEILARSAKSRYRPAH